MICDGCQWLMMGTWAMWCAKQQTPIIFIRDCEEWNRWEPGRTSSYPS